MAINRKYKVRTYAPHGEVLDWLHANVGPTLVSQPVIFWRGHDWIMIGGHEQHDEETGRHYNEVGFDDQKIAFWFSLQWS